MNLVIVMHEKCDKKFIFEIPKGGYVSAGDLVKVEGKNGNLLATCICDGFSIEEGSEPFNVILTALGSSIPPKKVLGKYSYHEFEPVPETEENE